MDRIKRVSKWPGLDGPPTTAVAEPEAFGVLVPEARKCHLLDC
jgi:hypothetical protein